MAGSDSDPDSYSFGLQGAGIAILFAVSLLGAGVSFLIAHKHLTSQTQLQAIAILLLSLKGLGTGVTISTALIHLIGEAYGNFEEAGWSEKYEAFPMVFAMIGLIIMSLSDFASRRSSVLTCDYEEGNSTSCSKHGDPEALIKFEHTHAGYGTNPSGADVTPYKQSSNDESLQLLGSKRRAAFMMELSVITHSVIVGLDLGLQNVGDWKTLVIAICFHQFFEGIALAQVVAEAQYATLRSAIARLVFFASMTPLGISIGMIVIASLGSDKTGQGVQALIAILNSICGGILLYIGLISLLKPWFVTNPALLRASKSYIMVAWASLVLGMAAMSVLAVWA